MIAREIDPIQFIKMCWPHVKLYDKQVEILYSVRDNDETVVPAGNQLGKDYIAGLVCIWFFCSRRPAGIVTTSVKEKQLEIVLWGEIRRLLDTSVVELPISYNHLFIRQVRNDGSLDPRAALTGEVSKKGEGLLGRHLERGFRGQARTMAVFDEASGIDDYAYESSDTWAHKKLIIGNPYPCTNFFKKGVKDGDLKAPDKSRYYRKVIRIRASDSPNVRYALAEIRAGKKPSGKILVPGVKDHDTYMKHRATWDKVRQSIGLDAEFYEGAESLLYPPDWLDLAESRHELMYGKNRIARAIGVDPGEGGANTAWAVVDDFGLMKLVSKKTPDTSEIPSITIALMNEFGVRPENVNFDRGGGGKQHADQLRAMGYKVRTTGFGESVISSQRFSKRMRTTAERKAEDEERYVYKNRRSEMFGLLRLKLDPFHEVGFSLPPEYAELRRQLSLFPLQYDREGRMILPPKNKIKKESNEETLIDIIGCSPDEADALVLANYALVNRKASAGVGVIPL